MTEHTITHVRLSRQQGPVAGNFLELPGVMFSLLAAGCLGVVGEGMAIMVPLVVWTKGIVGVATMLKPEGGVCTMDVKM